MNTALKLVVAEETATTVDPSNPWLGLASFTEETKAFFYGREEEVAELARRVQRKLLTVLFGQSGLGKTSILRAGLVPRLRGQGYCPVYVRIDYGREAPEPAEQIKQAISRTARHSGEWTQVGVAVAGETLWEFLHHRGDVLRDEAGATLTPLLIFDQFEEIFTLAQSDDFGRARAARFVEELADLVENRPPKSLESKLDEDDTAADRFDFARSDYRVLIALREDYLAPLESLKKAMPSISQNRLRLAPMTGTQALSAVLQPGGKLVTDEVAAAIVRFVAGGAELANADVEPSLLSLICRELNDARIAQKRREISLDLLAGSHATILSSFYERALADQPPAVRHIIEDDLLTASGYRENVAEENLISRFAVAGASPTTLAVLVNRRLLRIEERLDIRRVELTHDVLCGVVKNSRDQRHERESREATERLLSDQRAREIAARRSLVRARQIASVCTVLAVLAVVAAVVAYFNTQRALRAEYAAKETQAVADQARGEAEHLLGYLTDDFVRELESFGRLSVLTEFSQRQIDYFHGLPPALKGPETVRNGALALVHHGRAMRILGDLNKANADATEAEQLLEKQRQAGDRSEGTAIALTSAYILQAQILDNRDDAAGPKMARRAESLIRPIAEAPNASRASRRTYVEVLVRISFEEQASNQSAAAVPDAQRGMRYATELGARDLTSLDMGAYYAEAGAWLVSGLVNLGRNDEARAAGEDAVALADKVLEQRPGYRLALHAQQVIESALSNVAQNDMNPAEAIRIGERNAQISEALLRLDPKNTVSSNNLGVAYTGAGEALWGAGRLQEAIAAYQRGMDKFSQATAGGTGFFLIRTFQMVTFAYRLAQAGETAKFAETVASDKPFLAKLRATEPADSRAVLLIQAMQSIPDVIATFERDQLQDTRRLAAQSLKLYLAMTPNGDAQTAQKNTGLFTTWHVDGRAAYELGDFKAAEEAERKALAARTSLGTEAVPDKRDLGELNTWLAMALAQQGKTTEAAQIIAPAVAFQREVAAKNHGDKWLPLELACALYAQALADPKHRAALLQEAATLLDNLTPALRSLHDTRLWRERIQQSMKTKTTRADPAARRWSPG
jgi:tetratricopeptide (TPR) repeat protein